MSFATILPLIFGLAFQTPLVMLFLERIGIFTVDDFRSKRKIAILIITIAAARADARPGPVQHGPARRADDPALRAGHPHDRPWRAASRCRPFGWAVAASDGSVRTRLGGCSSSTDRVQESPARGRRSAWGRSTWWAPGRAIPGLLTRRGEALLAAADVVVYDHLASPRLLDLAPPEALRICAGKSVGHCTMTQDRSTRS